jgi:hypothetical protein
MSAAKPLIVGYAQLEKILLRRSRNQMPRKSDEHVQPSLEAAGHSARMLALMKPKKYLFPGTVKEEAWVVSRPTPRLA